MDGTLIPPLALARIGCLIPQGNVVCEQEFPSHTPAGYGIHFQRLRRAGTAVSSDSLLGMKAEAIESSSIFEPMEPRVIVYACTSGTFLSGPDRHDEVAREIQHRTGVPAVTTSTALLRALDVLGLRRVLMVTPYPHAVNAAEIDFLQHHGTEVVECASFECADFKGIRAISEGQVVQAVEDAARHLHGRIDGVFISCTNLGTLQSIQRLERTIGLPVISSNGVTLWAALRLAGFSAKLNALGTLGDIPHFHSNA